MRVSERSDQEIGEVRPHGGVFTGYHISRLHTVAARRRRCDKPTGPDDTWWMPAHLGGTANETPVHTPVQIGNGALALGVTGGRMYWTDFNDGLIRRANLAGSNPTTLTSGQNFPLGVSLDLPHGKMYWTDSHYGNNGQGGDIRRANLDGTGQETVLGTLPAPDGLALDLAAGNVFYLEELIRAFAEGTGLATARTSVPPPKSVQGAAYFTPCRDAEIVIRDEQLTVNNQPYGRLKPKDSVLVDHGVVSIRHQD